MAGTLDPPPCVIKSLPPEQLISASLAAVAAYPANGIPGERVATMLPLLASSITPQHIAAMTDKYWGPKPRQITVEFLDNPTPTFRRMLLESANSWDCSVTFVEVARDGQVRLTRAGGGFWSYLGTDILMVPPGQPTMNLQGFTERTPASEWLRLPTHEFGHTLGFVHEHLREELVRELVESLTIEWYRVNQGWPEAVTRANVLTPLSERSLMATPPDQTSVMCYWCPGSITRSGKPIVGGSRLNASDLAFADSIYPLPAPPLPPVPPPPPGPPPVVPPEPEPEDFGPFALKIGRPSETFELRPGVSFLFRFKAHAPRRFRFSAAGKGDIRLTLLSAAKTVLAENDGRPVRLAPGDYFLRAEVRPPESVARFRVLVT